MSNEQEQMDSATRERLARDIAGFIAQWPTEQVPATRVATKEQLTTKSVLETRDLAAAAVAFAATAVDAEMLRSMAMVLDHVGKPLAEERDAAVAERNALAAEVARLTKLLDGLAEHAARGSRAALEAAMVAIYDDWRARMAAMAAKGAGR